MYASRAEASSTILAMSKLCFDFPPPIFKQFVNEAYALWHKLARQRLHTACDRLPRQQVNFAVIDTREQHVAGFERQCVA